MTFRGRVKTGANGSTVIFCDDIVRVNTNDLEQLRLHVVTTSGVEATAYGVHAIDAAMKLCPEALEGQRLRWHKHVWCIHNLVGHPVMQVLAFLGLYKAAFWVHDVTVPKPKVS